jgi:hypothetical protein
MDRAAGKLLMRLPTKKEAACSVRCMGGAKERESDEGGNLRRLRNEADFTTVRRVGGGRSGRLLPTTHHMELSVKPSEDADGKGDEDEWKCSP